MEVRMTSRKSARMCASVTIAIGAAALMQFSAYAQQPRPATGGASGAQAGTMPTEQVTLTGCIQREAEYRKAHDTGRGGVAGTGVGAGNEFVLINASTSP